MLRILRQALYRGLTDAMDVGAAAVAGGQGVAGTAASQDGGWSGESGRQQATDNDDHVASRASHDRATSHRQSYFAHSGSPSSSPNATTANLASTGAPGMGYDTTTCWPSPTSPHSSNLLDHMRHRELLLQLVEACRAQGSGTSSSGAGASATAADPYATAASSCPSSPTSVLRSPHSTVNQAAAPHNPSVVDDMVAQFGLASSWQSLLQHPRLLELASGSDACLRAARGGVGGGLAAPPSPPARVRAPGVSSLDRLIDTLLEHGCPLQHLDLSGNSLEGRPGAALSTTLSASDTLTSLRLANMQVGVGVEVLRQADEGLGFPCQVWGLDPD